MRRVGGLSSVRYTICRYHLEAQEFGGERQHNSVIEAPLQHEQREEEHV